MILKSFDTTDWQQARITFIVPGRVAADSVHLVGDFNNWHPSSLPMVRTVCGQWSVTLELETDQAFEFGYLCDGQYWLPEYQADGFASSPDGRNTGIVTTKPYEKGAYAI